MAIGSVDRQTTTAPLPVLTETAGPQKPAYVERDISEKGFDRAELARDAEAASGAEAPEFSFWDFLDIVNPLQHIPIVNTIYREVTGDQIGSVAKMAGGGLFFGPVGLGFAALDVGVKEISGASIDEHVMAMINGEDAGENARLAEAAEKAKTLAAETGEPMTVGEAAPSAVPVGAVDRLGSAAGGSPQQTAMLASAPLGLFRAETAAASATGGPPAALTIKTRGETTTPDGQTAGQTGAPLGLISSVTPAERPVQQAAAPSQALVRPRGRMSRGTDAAPDHLLKAMQAQGLEVSKLMTVPTPAATAVSAQMIAAQNGGQTMAGIAAPSSSRPRPTPPAPVSQGRSAPPVSASVSGVGTGSGAETGQAPSSSAPAAGVVDVPAWFDTAMMKATTAYQKTGRLPAAATPSESQP